MLHSTLFFIVKVKKVCFGHNKDCSYTHTPTPKLFGVVLCHFDEKHGINLIKQREIQARGIR